MEEHVGFASGGLILEGRYTQRAKTVGAIITHPHPLYGGDMANPVVESLVRSFNRKNISTLRFNFRGTGKSEGSHDGGVGERQDVLSAISFLLQKGVTSIHLAGYSFGAWVIAHVQQLPAEVDGMIFISPPLAFLSFQDVHSLPLLQLVITGEEDEIAPVQSIREALAGWNAKACFEVINYADHFYFGCFDALEGVMHDYLSGAMDR